jgi:hypothetical protein
MRSNERGQSTIEFIVTFSLGLGVVFLFVGVALNYSAGFLVHYATFMASRTYLTTEANVSVEANNDNAAKAAALATFARFKMSALRIPAGSVLAGGGNAEEGFHINPYVSVSDPKDVLYVGAYTVFKRPISYLPLVAGGDPATLISESFLGKEPSRAECWKRTCEAILLGVSGAPGVCQGTNNYDFTIMDDGC